MYKLSDEVKQRLSKKMGIPYEKLIQMDDDEVTAYLEKKNGKKLGHSEPRVLIVGSGDDSVLIDKGRYITMEDVDKRIEKLTFRARMEDKVKRLLTKQEDPFEM